MRTHLVLLLALALFALPSCSALGLDNIPVSDCSRQGADWAAHDTFCNSLAASNPVPDTCHDWHCSHTSHHCEILPLDHDHDGAPDPMCAPTDPMADCDDMHASVAPNGMESCDGLDNDCDHIVDEDVIQMAAQTSTLTALAPPDQLAFAARTDADEITMVTHAAAGFSSTRITTTATNAALSFTQNGMMLGTGNTSAAIAAIGGDTPYALVVPRTATAGCGQLGLFPLGGVRSTALGATEPSLFPSCPGVAAVASPAVAGSSTGDVIFAWYDADEVERDCGTAPALPVMIGVGFLSSMMGQDQIGPDLQMLGSTIDYATPALLALDASHFLVAYPQMDGSIPVHLVTTQIMASVTRIASFAPFDTHLATGAMRQGVTLALGPTTGASTQIALAFHEGCSGADMITVLMLTFDGTALHLGPAPTTGIGAGTTREHLEVIYQPRSMEWLVSWDAGNGINAQRLRVDGTMEGTAFQIGGMTRPTRYVTQALRAGSLFRAVAYDGANLTQTTFGCAVTM